MTRAWIIVAESSRAKIYSALDPTLPLVEVEDLVHPQGRLHEGDLIADSPGSDGGTVGQGRRVLDPPTRATVHEAEAFARELARRLDKARQAGTFEKLVVAAPPAFLGLLRDVLSKDVKRLVHREVDKNLVREPVEVLRPLLD